MLKKKAINEERERKEMSRVSSIINTAYPRRIIVPGSEADQAFAQAYDCIQTAMRRTPVRKTVTCDVSVLRAAVLFDKIPFINISSLTHPFLAVFPRNLRTPQEFHLGEPIEISFESHPFTDAEMEVMSRSIPAFEPLFGDTLYFFDRYGKKIPTPTWGKEGMTFSEEFSYALHYHSSILEEIANLVLPEGALICDPACGNGRLVRAIKERFPQYRLVASDVNEKLAQQAKDINPSVPVCVSDAQDLSYLDADAVSLFIFCGLLNKSVVEEEEGEEILRQAIIRAKDYAYFIITGKTPPLFNAVELGRRGFYPVLRTKWSHFSFIPFYICLNPRKVEVDKGVFRIIPIVEELEGE